MPYRCVFVPAELFLDYDGVRVYRTYPGNDLDRGSRTYIFVLRPADGEAEGFDVRDLPTWLAPPTPPPLDKYGLDTPENRAGWRIYHERAIPEAIRQALRRAIDQGLIGHEETKPEGDAALAA
ncbi:MAG TPA: hypothetical protein VFZ25_12535 [Chloroflexota bacterium]|nr:hypothetical protein [Chloroflexota bacterium]